MAEQTRTLGFGITYDMAAARTACGQLLSLTSHRPGVEFPPHRHVNNYLCIVLRGGFSEVQGNVCRDRKAGSFFLHEAGETHFDRIGSRGATCLNLHFGRGESMHPHKEGRFSSPSKIAADKLAFELAAGTRDELVMAALAAEIVGESRGSGRPDRGNWLDRVIEAISDEPGRRWTLNEIAIVAGRHPVRVAQVFRATTGMSLGAFQRLRRLTSLSLALRRDKTPLALLAAEYGYCDQSHMNSEFRAAFGVSSGRYRTDLH